MHHIIPHYTTEMKTSNLFSQINHSDLCDLCSWHCKCSIWGKGQLIKINLVFSSPSNLPCVEDIAAFLEKLQQSMCFACSKNFYNNCTDRPVFTVLHYMLLHSRAILNLAPNQTLEPGSTPKIVIISSITTITENKITLLKAEKFHFSPQTPVLPNFWVLLNYSTYIFSM